MIDQTVTHRKFVARIGERGIVETNAAEEAGPERAPPVAG